MKGDYLNRVRARVDESEVSGSTVALILLCILTVTSGVVAGQAVEETFSDDFEDGDVDGWEEPESGTTPRVSTDSYEGSYSLHAQTEDLSSSVDQPAFEWTAGPVLDLDDDFEATGIVKHNGSGDTATSRIGIPSDNQRSNNAFIIFDDANNITYLAQNSSEVPDSTAKINDAFADEWVRFKLASDAGSDELRAKVWRAGEAEPTDWQMINSGFENVDPGKFAVNPGADDSQPRDIWLDSVKIVGTEATDPALRLESNQLLLGGETTEYEVEYKYYDERLGRNTTKDVTDNTSVESLDESGLTVDNSSHEFVATTNESYADRVQTRAEYNGSVDYHYVAVIGDGQVDIEHLEILPPVYRITTFLGDWTVFLFLIASFAGIWGTRAASSFMGLSMMEFIILVGWFGGYVSQGLMFVSVFMSVFLGLNLAANIDYTVRR